MNLRNFFSFFSFFSFSVLTFLFTISTAYGYGIGVSPEKLIFVNTGNDVTVEESIFIINPNNFEVNYSIKGCNHDFLEFLRTGKVEMNSKRQLLVRYNPDLNNNVSECSLDLFSSNNVYATGFTIKLYFNNQQEEPEDSDNSQDNTNFLFNGFFGADNSNTAEPNNKAPNITLIVVACAIFIIALLIIIKFL